MNTTDLPPIVQQATVNQSAHRSWCLLHPEQVLEMAECVRRAEDAERRLSRIAAIIDGVPPAADTPGRIGALQLWCENTRDELRDALYEVRELATL